MTGKNISKLGFSDLLKSDLPLNSNAIKTSNSDFKQIVDETRKRQVEVLKLKDLNDSQLKIVIKL